MGESAAGEPVPGDAGQDVAVQLARRRRLEQIATLVAQAPGHQLSVETWPGRGERFVAQAITLTARPYLVVTDDLDELCAELACSPATAGTSSPSGPGDEKP